MKKRIFAMMLIAALMLSLAMFASSCTQGDGEEEEELGEEISITVNVKVTGNDGNVIVEEQMPMTDYQSNLTVLEATIRALGLHDIYHEEADGYFQLIGSYRNTGYISPNDEPTEEAAEGEEVVEETDGAGYYWAYKLNGTDPTSGAKEQELKDGDTIEWNFIQEDF